MLEIRIAAMPHSRISAPSRAEYTRGFSISSNLHPIFNNQTIFIWFLQFYCCWLLVLCSFPRNPWLSYPCLLPILQLPPSICCGRGNRKQELSLALHSGNTMWLFQAAGVSQGHSFHVSPCQTPASSRAEHIPSFCREFSREFSQCLPGVWLCTNQQHFHVFCNGHSNSCRVRLSKTFLLQAFQTVEDRARCIPSMENFKSARQQQ